MMSETSFSSFPKVDPRSTKISMSTMSTEIISPSILTIFFSDPVENYIRNVRRIVEEGSDRRRRRYAHKQLRLLHLSSYIGDVGLCTFRDVLLTLMNDIFQDILGLQHEVGSSFRLYTSFSLSTINNLSSVLLWSVQASNNKNQPRFRIRWTTEQNYLPNEKIESKWRAGRTEYSTHESRQQGSRISFKYYLNDPSIR